MTEQLSRLFPEVEDSGVKFGSQDNNDHQKIDESPIPELTDILSKIDNGEVPKQLEFSEGRQNKKFENKVKLIGLSTDLSNF